MNPSMYGCTRCHKQASVEKDAVVPRCCGRPMEPLPFCTSVPNPEMARNYADDEPCADGTVRKPEE